MRTRQRLATVAAVSATALISATCSSAEDVATGGGAGDGDGEGSGTASGSITVYTCVTDVTEEAVVEAFESSQPEDDVDVEVFRAPTGELNARVAGDLRSGGLRADVIWACDPLSMQGYVDQGIIREWKPENASDIPDEYQTRHAVGAGMLYMVAIVRDGTPPPSAWSDLTGPDYAGAVAVPDPSLAASAMGTLGYFAQADDYGLSFYEDLAGNGAVQVGTPSDVIAGVAQGTHEAGITISKSAYQAVDDGSPIEVVWPEPGAVPIYAPIAIAARSSNEALAKEFVTYVLSPEGQQVVADSGADVTRPDTAEGMIPDDAPLVAPDWESMFGESTDMLEDYQKIFGN